MMAFLFRTVGIAFSVALSIFVYQVVWGQFQPDIATPDTAMWEVFKVSTGLMIYLIVQARVAQMHPPGRAATWIMDIIFSVLPLFTVGAAFVATYALGHTPLTQYQFIVLCLAALATMTDLVFFTLFAPDTHHGSSPISVLPHGARR